MAATAGQTGGFAHHQILNPEVHSHLLPLLLFAHRMVAVPVAGEV